MRKLRYVLRCLLGAPNATEAERYTCPLEWDSTGFPFARGAEAQGKSIRSRLFAGIRSELAEIKAWLLVLVVLGWVFA